MSRFSSVQIVPVTVGSHDVEEGSAGHSPSVPELIAMGHLPSTVSTGSTSSIAKLKSSASSSSGWTPMGSLSSGLSGGNCENVSQVLEDARKEGRRRLLALRGPTLSLSSIMLAGGMVVYFFSVDYNWQFFLSYMALVLSPALMSLSLLPSDKRCIPIVMATAFVPSCLLCSMYSFSSGHAKLKLLGAGADSCSEFNYGGYTVPCHYGVVVGYCNIATGLVCLTVCLSYGMPLVQGQDSARMLKSMWRGIGVLMGCLAAFDLLRVAGMASLGFFILSAWFLARFIVHLLISALAFHGSLAGRVQAWLMSGGSGVAAAASISVLLGARDPNEVLSMAKSSFRYVSADKITREDMADNVPNAKLADLTHTGRMGTVDAFLSHSWHDNAEGKWAALQQWRLSFKSQHEGREPHFWIDKYCIDQNNIGSSLACLPVYLAGCKKLLVLCGATYLDRLWCMVEIFVFLEMGADLCDLEVITCGTQPEGLAAFDVRNARCFDDDDTARLQYVIQAAGYQRINQLVEDVFPRRVRPSLRSSQRLSERVSRRLSRPSAHLP